VRVAGGPWLVPQSLADGPDRRLAVWNASPDEVERFTVHAPHAGFRRALQVDAGGAIRDAAVADGVVRLAAPLRQWELAVLW
jgi:hypothetical protein